MFHINSKLGLSLPSILDATGVRRVLELPLNRNEIDGLIQSAQILKDTIKESGL